jgi:hypothetical protein
MDDIVKHIPYPDASSHRKRARLNAKANMTPLNQAQCLHPISKMAQVVDDVGGGYERPINLFRCGECDGTLFLIDGFG